MAPATEHWKEIDALREAHRFFWNTYGPGYWVLTRYDDIREAAHKPDIFSNHSIVATDPEPAYRFLPSFVDPPQHIKYRKLMNWWFAPAAVQKMAPRIAELARETIEPLVPAGRTDFCETFGDQYPVKVFLLSVGLDTSDADFFVSCVRRMSGAITGREEDVAQMMAAWGEIAAYWTDKVAARHAQPLDPDVDFVSHLCRSELDGAPLPDADIIDLMVTLTLGSLDTLKSQLGWCFYHLATHPEDRRRLLAEPDLIRQRGRGVPARLSDRPDGAEGDQGRRLPRLPDAQGRHGHAHVPGGHQGPAPVPRRGQGDHRQVPRTGTSRSAPASTAASARTSRAPSCRRRSASGTGSSPTTGWRPTSRRWPTAARSRC